MKPLLCLECVSKTYETNDGQCVVALSHISFSMERGEFLTVIGPQGSGKSTLLRIIGGLERPTSGKIEFGSSVTPPIGFVFQANTVFPWRTVERNLTYSLEVRGIEREKRQEEASRIAEEIGLDPEIYFGKYPRELSGGEVRHVAIGMALSSGAKLLLLDEPTAQLDIFARVKIQKTIQRRWRTQGTTVICATHDLDEAILLGDRVLMLDQGGIVGLIPIDLEGARSNKVVDAERLKQYRLAILEKY